MDKNIYFSFRNFDLTFHRLKGSNRVFLLPPSTRILTEDDPINTNIVEFNPMIEIPLYPVIISVPCLLGCVHNFKHANRRNEFAILQFLNPGIFLSINFAAPKMLLEAGIKIIRYAHISHNTGYGMSKFINEMHINSLRNTGYRFSINLWMHRIAQLVNIFQTPFRVRLPAQIRIIVNRFNVCTVLQSIVKCCTAHAESSASFFCCQHSLLLLAHIVNLLVPFPIIAVDIQYVKAYNIN